MSVVTDESCACGGCSPQVGGMNESWRAAAQAMSSPAMFGARQEEQRDLDDFESLALDTSVEPS